MTALWTVADAVRATAGSSAVDWAASGVSIDTRRLAAGRPLRRAARPNHDGHDFVTAALERGRPRRWSTALSRQPGVPRRCSAVGDTLAGLAALGRFARARSRARTVAVTGSVGKTGTKEALRLALGAWRDAFRLVRQPQQSLGRAVVARAHAAPRWLTACSSSA